MYVKHMSSRSLRNIVGGVLDLQTTGQRFKFLLQKETLSKGRSDSYVERAGLPF